MGTVLMWKAAACETMERKEDGSEMDFRDIGGEHANWIMLAQNYVQCRL
jgi:hypothetical protein